MFIVFSPFTNPDKYTTAPPPWSAYFFESTPLMLILSIVPGAVIYIPCSLANSGFCTLTTPTVVLSLYEYPVPPTMFFQTTTEGSLVVVSSGTSIFNVAVADISFASADSEATVVALIIIS